MSNNTTLLSCLRKWISEHQIRGVARLPSLRMIAAQFQCSKTSAARALRQLEQDGLLKCQEPTGRYILTALEPMQYAVPRLQSRAQEILHAIVADLENSWLQPGTAVGCARDYQRRFGASHATIAASLAELLRLGRLVRKGRRYFLPEAPLAPVPSQKSSRLIIAGHTDFKRLLERHMAGFSDRLRERLSQAGWPEALEFFAERPNMITWPPVHQIAGIVSVATSAKWQRYISKLKNVPVASIDYFSSGTPLLYRNLKECHHLGIGNRQAGGILGQHLKTSGAKRIAFISHHPPLLPWVKHRIEGLSAWYSPSDSQGKAAMLVFDADGIPEISRNDSADIILDEYLKRIDNAARKSGYLSSPALRVRLEGAYALPGMIRTAQRCTAIFEQALAISNIDAWVCVNDELASIAQHFLAAKRKSRKILIASFDNSVLSAQEQITSVDLRKEYLADLAFDALLHRIPKCDLADGPLFPEPRLWIRESTRRGTA